jgi:hypothetical protein
VSAGHIARFAWMCVASLTLRTCPDCTKADYVFRVIAHLNDDHRWTRERIADFVETIERHHEPLIENADQAAEHVSVTVPSAAQKD